MPPINGLCNSWLCRPHAHLRPYSDRGPRAWGSGGHARCVEQHHSARCVFHSSSSSSILRRSSTGSPSDETHWLPNKEYWYPVATLQLAASVTRAASHASRKHPCKRVRNLSAVSLIPVIQAEDRAALCERRVSCAPRRLGRSSQGCAHILLDLLGCWYLLLSQHSKPVQPQSPFRTLEVAIALHQSPSTHRLA